MSDIISGFDNSFRLNAATSERVEIGRLSLPPGNYSIWAKLFVGIPLPAGEKRTIQFRLQAGNDFDVTTVEHDGITAFVPVVLNVVHAFRFENGEAVLTAEYLFIGGETDLSFIKVTALSGASLTNGPLTGSPVPPPPADEA